MRMLEAIREVFGDVVRGQVSRLIRRGQSRDDAVAYTAMTLAWMGLANLVSVELNANNVSGGLLESAERVELGTIAPGQTATATFRIRSQKTGAISFSNLTTSDDSVIGRFRLKTGVDERDVVLSPDTLLLPEFQSAGARNRSLN